ncbi:MAG TPA: DUF2244 domain-containing protein, partial [Acetobacteraceae bacterium]
MFEALIVPHRSLSVRGVRMLAGAVLVLCGGTAGLFIQLGAWPVGGFAALELALMGWLFRLHMRSARASELLLLSPSGLRVVRTDMHGVRREQVLPPAWLQVRLEERQGRAPALLLVSRGRAVEVGASLGEAQRRDLAEALAQALHRWRNPV